MEHNSSDEERNEFMRSRVGRQRWKGDEMELKREQPSNKDASAGVDLEQFRNYQVGIGYQAKHVVRQRGLQSDGGAVGSTSRPEITGGETKKRKAQSSEGKATGKRPAKEDRLQRFLRCEGFRKFRKELETIMTS